MKTGISEACTGESFQNVEVNKSFCKMFSEALVDSHDKGTIISQVVITKFFSDYIWIDIHIIHMPSVLLTGQCGAAAGH